MAQVDIQEICSKAGAKITVVGVGGGGSNMIAHLINTGYNEDITLIAANTDLQHLESCPAKNKIRLGEKLTKGLGAGSRPEIGKEAAKESYEHIKETLNNSDIVFVSTGLGGGTGTGAAPVIAEAAKEIGALTIAVVTKPFKIEGKKRQKMAEEGLSELKEISDAIVVIPNEKLLSIIGKNTGLKESFKEIDAVLARAVNGISGIILNHGDSNDINVDFADLRTVMSHKGLALMGIGEATGENAALEAAKNAIECPLFDNVSINGAMGVLIYFEVSSNYPTLELTEAVGLIEENAHEDVDLKMGYMTVPNMENDRVKVTIVATGFEKEIINLGDSIKDSISPSPKSDPFQFSNIDSLKLASGGEDLDYVNLDIPTYSRAKKD